MKKRNFLNTIGVTLVALSMVACGSSGDGTSPNMTLGITSLGSGTTATKPSFASNFMGKAAHFFSVNEAVANNKVGVCADPTNGDNFRKIVEAGTGDTIWIYRAYAILDEIQFEDVNSSSDSIDDNIQHVIDLLDNDSNVSSDVPLFVPEGLVAKAIKFKFQRLEDDQLSIFKGVTDRDQFFAEIGFNPTANDQTRRVRPSVYLRGDMLAGGNCQTYQLVADGRVRTRVPFASGTFDTASLKGVLQVDIVNAFINSTATVAGLVGELGLQLPSAGDSHRLPGGDYLDGRTKRPGTGSTNAKAWATGIVSTLEVFTKDLGSDNSLDGTSTHVSGSDGDNSTDDNPSVEDLNDPAV